MMEQSKVKNKNRLTSNKPQIYFSPLVGFFFHTYLFFLNELIAP